MTGFNQDFINVWVANSLKLFFPLVLRYECLEHIKEKTQIKIFLKNSIDFNNELASEKILRFGTLKIIHTVHYINFYSYQILKESLESNYQIFKNFIY